MPIAALSIFTAALLGILLLTGCVCVSANTNVPCRVVGYGMAAP